MSAWSMPFEYINATRPVYPSPLRPHPFSHPLILTPALSHTSHQTLAIPLAPPLPRSQFSAPNRCPECTPRWSRQQRSRMYIQVVAPTEAWNIHPGASSDLAEGLQRLQCNKIVESMHAGTCLTPGCPTTQRTPLPHPTLFGLVWAGVD